MYLLPYFKGLAAGAGLIIAIGAQNAFVLSQGIKRSYTFLIPLICSLSDAVLISAGVLGVGGFFSSNPGLIKWASWGGAAFLSFYGIRSLISAFQNNKLVAEDSGPVTAGATVVTTLAVTLLNPHVYLDTVVLLGSISSSFPGSGRYFFGAGAVTASFIWFFTLSFGGRKLSPFFKNPAAWRILDIIIAAIMFFIAFSLLRMQFKLLLA